MSNCVGCRTNIRIHYMNCGSSITYICFYVGYCLTLWISWINHFPFNSTSSEIISMTRRRLLFIQYIYEFVKYFHFMNEKIRIYIFIFINLVWKLLLTCCILNSWPCTTDIRTFRWISFQHTRTNVILNIWSNYLEYKLILFTFLHLLDIGEITS